jgi:NitT/TauT family transport system substrate-binding protein
MNTVSRHVGPRLAVALMLLVSLAAVGCGSSSSSTSSGSASSSGTGSTAASSATSSTSASSGATPIRMALVSAATANLPFQVAENDGYFKQQGLNVSLSTPSIPFSELPATLGKQFDVVIGSQPDLIRAHASGLDVVTIAGLQKDNPLDPGAALVVPGNSPIKTIADLKGKTVGAPSTVGNNWTALQCWAQKAGVGPTDFKGLQGPTPQLPDLLKQGRFDSILIFEPLLTPAVKSGDRNIGNAYAACFGHPEYTALLVSQGAWASSHAQAISKFIAALNEAKAEIAKDPQAAKQLFIKTSGLPAAAAEGTPVIADEFDFSQGQPLVSDLQVWLKLLNSLGTFKGNVDPSSLVAGS